jgi:uncharacterized membrane protein
MFFARRGENFARRHSPDSIITSIIITIIIMITIITITIIMSTMPIVRTIIMMMLQPWRPLFDSLAFWPAAAGEKGEGPKIGRAPK